MSMTDKAKPEKIEESIAILRELNPKAPFITTPLEQLAGSKILETMESVRSMEEELLAEVVCPECGHHHGAHHHDHGEDEHHHEHHHHDHGECEHHHEHHHHDHGECEHHHDHHHHDNGEDGSHHDHHHHDCGCGHDHAGHHHADEVFTSWGRETIHVYSEEQVGEILKSLENEEEYGDILRAKGMVKGEDGTWIYFDMVPGEYEVRTGAPEYTGRICVIGAKINEEKLEKLFGL